MSNPQSTICNPKSVQLGFDLGLSANRPLVPMEAAMVCLDRSEDDVLNLIETGAIRWAFDLKHPEAKRREVRIWRESLVSYAKDRSGSSAESRQLKAGKECGPDGSGTRRYDVLADVIKKILPGSEAEIAVTRLCRLWTCSATHLYDLIACDELLASGRAERGPNGSAKVRRESAVDFLRGRVM